MPTPAIRTKENFLIEANASDIKDFLFDTATVEEGYALMTELLANRPAVANEVLCLAYSVWCYEVTAQNTESMERTPPAEDFGKWFTSVSVPSPFELDEDFPLADTESACHALAVDRFQLRSIFFGQPMFGINTAGTVTGRFSSTQSNASNSPKPGFFA